MKWKSEEGGHEYEQWIEKREQARGKRIILDILSYYEISELTVKGLWSFSSAV
jgi:hypothetical protein